MSGKFNRCGLIKESCAIMVWLFFLRGILWGEKVRLNIRENDAKEKSWI